MLGRCRIARTGGGIVARHAPRMHHIQPGIRKRPERARVIMQGPRESGRRTG
jgi:hypothetical protein